jgi:hypothetical protein
LVQKRRPGATDAPQDGQVVGAQAASELGAGDEATSAVGAISDAAGAGGGDAEVSAGAGAAAPHEGQKRAVPGSGRPQLEQFIVPSRPIC